MEILFLCLPPLDPLDFLFFLLVGLDLHGVLQMCK